MSMALIHSASQEAITGTIWGTVDRKFAEGRHPKWYREVTGRNISCEREIE